MSEWEGGLEKIEEDLFSLEFCRRLKPSNTLIIFLLCAYSKLAPKYPCTDMMRGSKGPDIYGFVWLTEL